MFETILTGVFVYVLGQIMLKLVIEPIHALKSAFADVSESFIVNAPFIYNPDNLSAEQKDELKDRMLKQAANLRAKLMLVPAYNFWRFVFFMTSKVKIHESATGIVAIGNWCYSGSSAKMEQIIQKVQHSSDNLGIYVPPNSRVSEELLQEAIDASFGRSKSE